MAVHIFSVNEENYRVCIRRGLVGLPEPGNTSRKNSTLDGLISRLSAVRDNDYILMYVTGKKELRGLWKAEGRAFYDETPVWEDKIYPLRCKIKCSEFRFTNSLKLNDIRDLQNMGMIWTWALQRATGANAMFSVSDKEFEVLLAEYMKINPFTMSREIIPEPYPCHEYNLMNYIHIEDHQPKYEYSIMALLNDAFANNKYTDIFGNYTDYLSYVPTSLGREMDIMLMFANPITKNSIVSYDIIEVKRSVFDEKALAQLIDYESWFLHKKAAGDLKMLRTTAIARSYSETVIDYVRKRGDFENKRIKLLTYDCAEEGHLKLTRIL